MAVSGEGNEKIVYEQNDVFVHTAVKESTFNDNIIRGKLCIVENGLNVTVDWQPSADLTPELEYEVHSLFSGPIEYGVVTTSMARPRSDDEDEDEDEPVSKKVECKYRVSFDVEEIQCIRRSDPRLAWSYLIVILKDGTTQPALHFHNGGIKDLISRLQRYIWLTKSPITKNLYIRQERDAAMESTLNQFELFSEHGGDSFSKFINNTYYGTLSGFSKVTDYVLKGIGKNEMQDYRPSRDEDDDDQDYEILHFLEPSTTNNRSSPLQPEEWCTYMNDQGQIENVEELQEKIFRGGIHNDIKREAWKFLLGYYKCDSTYEERIQHKLNQRNLYYIMKNQWESITPEQEARFTDFAQRKHIVDKDAVRTDRKMEYYAGDDNPNVKRLNDILMTYCMYNFDLGYVQGMSDLLSPILLLMDDEVEAFWCFVGFMEMEERTFEMNQSLMKEQLDNLGKLVEYIFPEFWAFLVRKEAQNLFCCFRWILVSFRREFGLGDIMTLWEALWTQKLSPHFKLFVCVAVLEYQKEDMMKNDEDFNEIIKHINLLSGGIDLNKVLARAEYIILNLREREHLPDSIAKLITFPTVDNDTSAEQNGHHVDTIETVNSEDMIACRRRSSGNIEQHDSSTSITTISDDAVVELQENSESIF